MPAGQATLIRHTGERLDIHRKLSMHEIRSLIQAETLDTVPLKDGHVMMVDDQGIERRRPPNPAATYLYHRIRATGNRIFGDVVIVWDADYA